MRDGKNAKLERESVQPPQGTGWRYHLIRFYLFFYLFSFQGRIRRTDWWVLQLLLLVTVGVLASLLLTSRGGDRSHQVSLTLLERGGAWLIVLAWFYAKTAINVKRWHDRDRSGWWTLLSFVPLLNLWALVECGLLDGTEGQNRFGPDPRGRAPRLSSDPVREGS